MLDSFQWLISSAETSEADARAILGDAYDPISQKVLSRRVAHLPFYSLIRLVELTLGTAQSPVRIYALLHPEACWLLDGSSGPVHDANEREVLEITEDTAADYLRFFLFAVRANGSAFFPLEDVPKSAHDKSPLAAYAAPIAGEGLDEQGRFQLVAPIAYQGSLFRAQFAVARSGLVEMINDVGIDAPFSASDIPFVPPLVPMAQALQQLAAQPRPGTDHKRDALAVSPLSLMVELLLDASLAPASAQGSLIGYFNARTGTQTVFRRFAEFVATAHPVVTVECSIPFVEAEVAQIISRNLPGDSRMRIVSAEPIAGDEARLRMPAERPRNSIVLVPLHSYSGIADVERAAHALAIEEVSALVGCTNYSTLPEPLRRIVDMRLKLPKLSPPIFETLFSRLMGAPLPAGWAADGAQWVGHVHHTDLLRPLRLSLDPAEAFAVIRDRVRARLSAVETHTGIGLQDLHGLGEARRFAEDLISDIAAAMNGRISWDATDRGVLLSGPPGTGKTTLARAIARDCGIKFVTASATAWQSAGNLSDHLRAIRADFAQARDYAPAILFIDEIDSVGNRQNFTGANAQYSTEVVNGVLEQMNGLDFSAPVIVIAATNDPERVDPALRRAGRLDRLIQIPLPNVDALSRIYGHYLSRHAGLVDADVQTDALAALSIGLTGADVESMVRGASRRARQAGRPVSQSDLVAEITGKPRDESMIQRLSPAELEQLAFHEAGHACARVLSSTGGRDLTFISIVPRGNGTLGFVAHLPNDSAIRTRLSILEEIEIVLAGRAAEELRYGPEGVSGGAGGNSRSSDLAVASGMALYLVAKLGLGTDKSLLWLNEHTAVHNDEAERLLRQAYENVTQKLRKNWSKTERVAASLVRKQELTGAELRVEFEAS